MSAYIIADITLFAPDSMTDCSAVAHQAMVEHGAELLVLGNEIEPLEGDWNPRRLVVLRFDDRLAAKRFYGSDTYAKARSLRAGVASFRTVVVDGLPDPTVGTRSASSLSDLATPGVRVPIPPGRLSSSR